MESLALTNMLASGMLSAGAPTLKDHFAPILHLTSWQQAPQAKAMLHMEPIVSQMVEAWSPKWTTAPPPQQKKGQALSFWLHFPEILCG